MEQWNGFKGTKWKEGVDTRDFIQITTLNIAVMTAFGRPNRSNRKLWDELQS